MIIKSALRIVLLAFLMPFILPGCQSTLGALTMSSCKAVETNIAKCSELIANDISDKNANVLVSVDEGDL